MLTCAHHAGLPTPRATGLRPRMPKAATPRANGCDPACWPLQRTRRLPSPRSPAPCLSQVHGRAGPAARRGRHRLQAGHRHGRNQPARLARPRCAGGLTHAACTRHAPVTHPSQCVQPRIRLKPCSLRALSLSALGPSVAYLSLPLLTIPLSPPPSHLPPLTFPLSPSSAAPRWPLRPRDRPRHPRHRGARAHPCGALP